MGRKIFSCCFVFFTLFSSYAQLLLDTSRSAEYLVKEVLLGNKSDLIIENVKYSGKRFSIAAFVNANPEELIDSGIFLSTGSVFDVKGPNQSTNTGVRSSGLSDPSLQAIATGVVTDAVILEFDLTALRDSIAFEYVFASEEYPEYVDKGVNDVFGFFIQEIGSKSLRPKNIARLPDNRTNVSIDNVNHRKNENYFLKSDFIEGHDFEYWEQHPKMLMRAQLFEFDGFTVPLRAKAILNEGKTYHLKIALADVGDRFYDSGVFLKANSMASVGKRVPSADSIVKRKIEGKVKNSQFLKIIDKGKLNFSLLVNFNTNEFEILPESIEPINQLAELLTEFQDLKVVINGHTDDVGNSEKNLKLSIDRANSVKEYLLSKNIKMNRLSAFGFGEERALNANSNEEERKLNRRVEFELSY